MPQARPRSEAFIWQGNPRKWHGSGTMASYLADKSNYIYWSTPQCRDEIREGDRAYIWRALSEGPRGIVAAGTVKERPRQFLPANMAYFKHPERVGIGEEAASSVWKTGISIFEVRLTVETGMLTADMLTSACPNLHILRGPQATVYRLDAEQCRKIETLWASNG